MNKENPMSGRSFKKSSAWLILAFGIFFYVLGFAFLSGCPVWKEISLKVGDVLVIGVILGYLTNLSSFFHVFKEELENIIYGKEFLKKRNDILEIWDNVSEQMFENKFPEIHEEFLEVIRGYFPQEEVSYYNDYVTDAEVTWDDKENDIIKVTDNVSFELKAKSKDPFVYPLRSWGQAKSISDYKCEVSKLEVNGVKQDNITKKKSISEDIVCAETEIPLTGYTEYNIKYKRVRVYSLRNDFFIGFQAQYIVKRFRVSLTHPKDLKVVFTCRGTQKDFQETAKTSTRIGEEYKGIILPRQGYIFVLQKCN